MLPWSFKKGSLKNPPSKRQAPPAQTTQWNWIKSSELKHLSKVPHRRPGSEARFCLPLQRAKLIPRVLIQIEEPLPTWLAKHSHLKIDDECVLKCSFYTDDLFFLSTAGGKHIVYDCKLAKSVSTTEMEFLLE